MEGGGGCDLQRVVRGGLGTSQLESTGCARLSRSCKEGTKTKLRPAAGGSLVQWVFGAYLAQGLGRSVTSARDDSRTAGLFR